MCVSTASCVCFYGRELQLKLADVRVDDQVGCAPAHQQTVQMPRKLRQEKTHLSLRFCSPAPPEPPKKASHQTKLEDYSFSSASSKFHPQVPEVDVKSPEQIDSFAKYWPEAEAQPVKPLSLDGHQKI